MLTRQSYFRDSESDCSICYLREMSHDVMQSFVTLSANSPCFTIKTESFAHALDNDDSAKPRNCSIVTRPFPSLRAGSGYETSLTVVRAAHHVIKIFQAFYIPPYHCRRFKGHIIMFVRESIPLSVTKSAWIGSRFTLAGIIICAHA